MAITQLALHYPKPDLTAEQFEIVRGDMIRDLASFHPGRVAQACDAWRRSGERFFPTSGQIIKIIGRLRDESVERAKASTAARLPPPRGQEARKLKPWRQVLAEKGNEPKPGPLAAALDALQGNDK